MGVRECKIVELRLYQNCISHYHINSTPISAVSKVFDWDTPASDIALACIEQNAIKQACDKAQKFLADERDCPVTAVYVLAVDGYTFCKVGVSGRPQTRINALKGAHWADISFYGLFWMAHKAALKTERDVLAWASNEGLRRNGEWVEASPGDLTMKIAEAVKEHKVRAFDSATWFENSNAVLKEIREVGRRAEIKATKTRQTIKL